MVNTGNGKGKTTAAIGLAIRALGAGFNVYMGQFLKKGEYSETVSLKRFSPELKLEQYGVDRVIGQPPTEEDTKAATAGLESIKKALISGLYDLVIADEINVAIHMGILEEPDVLRLMKNKPDTVEFVLTGRYATDAVIEMADVVTNMTSVKHHLKKGVAARKGIEK